MRTHFTAVDSVRLVAGVKNGKIKTIGQACAFLPEIDPKLVAVAFPRAQAMAKGKNPDAEDEKPESKKELSDEELDELTGPK